MHDCQCCSTTESRFRLPRPPPHTHIHPRGVLSCSCARASLEGRPAARLGVVAHGRLAHTDATSGSTQTVLPLEVGLRLGVLFLHRGLRLGVLLLHRGLASVCIFSTASSSFFLTISSSASYFSLSSICLPHGGLVGHNVSDGRIEGDLVGHNGLLYLLLLDAGGVRGLAGYRVRTLLGLAHNHRRWNLVRRECIECLQMQLLVGRATVILTTLLA